MSENEQPNEQPHIGLAILATGIMALALAAGLDFLGIIRKMDAFLSHLLSPQSMPSPTISLNPSVLWGGSAILAFLLPAIILNIPSLWRRLLVWSLTFVLTLAWGPVLLLASHKPEITIALIAVLWSGFCAIFYSSNHALPVDQTPHKNHGES